MFHVKSVKRSSHDYVALVSGFSSVWQNRHSPAQCSGLRGWPGANEDVCMTFRTAPLSSYREINISIPFILSESTRYFTKRSPKETSFPFSLFWEVFILAVVATLPVGLSESLRSISNKLFPRCSAVGPSNMNSWNGYDPQKEHKHRLTGQVWYVLSALRHLVAA